MLGATLRSELSRSDVNLAKVKDLCRRNPIGSIVDNKMRSRVWAVLLLEGKEPPPIVKYLSAGDGATSGKKPATMSAEDARVLDADVKRTRQASLNARRHGDTETPPTLTMFVAALMLFVVCRGYLPMFQVQSTQELIRSLLTAYCVTTGMKYKQGMHELFAPFVALSDPPLSPDLIYGMFESFIRRYLSPFFRDDGMEVLQIGFKLFNLLLLDHDPELGQHLDRNEFPPSFYATPWFMTLFAHSLEMYLVHRLWDSYISLDDPTLIYYLCVALLKLKRDTLLAADAGELPEVISSIRISTPEDIAQLLPIALEACRNTPQSFVSDLRRTTLVGSCADGDLSEQQGVEAEMFSDEGVFSMVWHARDDCTCIEISSAELVESVLAAAPWQRNSPKNLPPAPTAAGVETRRLSYVIIDARSSEEHGISGGGRICGSVRLEPQVVFDGEGVQEWMGSKRITKGTHICVIGSKVVRRGGKDDKLWKRLLFGDGDGNEHDGQVFDDQDTADCVVRVLRDLGFARVGKLKGTMENVIDFMVLSRRKVTPIIENHDAALWDRWRRKQFKQSNLPPWFFTPYGMHSQQKRSSKFEDSPYAATVDLSDMLTGPASPAAARPGGVGPAEMADLESALAVAEARRHTSMAKTLREKIDLAKQVRAEPTEETAAPEFGGAEAQEGGEARDRGFSGGIGQAVGHARRLLSAGSGQLLTKADQWLKTGAAGQQDHDDALEEFWRTSSPRRPNR